MSISSNFNVSRRRTATVWVIVGIVMVALTLRAPVIAPTAVIDTIQADTGLTASGAGLLTGLPVFLFAAAAPLATRLIRKSGAEMAVIMCLAGVLLGTVIRSAGPASVVLLGTVVIGVAITIGNIVLPVIIRREVSPHRVSLVTGVYIAAMNIGSMATLLGTVPLAELVGWRWSIASWTVVTTAALFYWTLRRQRSERRDPGDGASSNSSEMSTSSPSGRFSSSVTAGPSPQAHSRASFELSWHRRRMVPLLMLAFSGQAAAYFGTTTWLPLMLAETGGLSAAASGAAASLFQIAAIVGALGVPLLAARFRTSVPMFVVAICWVTLPLGLLFAPEAYVLWCIIGGVAQGGGFTAIFSLIPRLGGNETETAKASAQIQGMGYLAATCAPPLAGGLYSLSGGWAVPLLLILATTLTFTVGGLLAAHRADRVIQSEKYLSLK